jgi:hypothetical protein
VTWIAAIVGFIAGFVASFLIYVSSTVAPECDGPCFDEWDWLLPVSIGVGTASAIVCGLAAHSVSSRRRCV